jgi:hypothetical protein
MSVMLNHTIVWCRDEKASARYLTEILGQPSRRLPSSKKDPIPCCTRKGAHLLPFGTCASSWSRGTTASGGRSRSAPTGMSGWTVRPRQLPSCVARNREFWAAAMNGPAGPGWPSMSTALCAD